MPVSLTDLTSDTAHVPVVYNGHTITVEYAPSLVTEKALGDLLNLTKEGNAVANLPNATPNRAARRKGATATPTLSSANAGHFSEMLEYMGALNTLIVRLVRSWDLTEDDEHTVPFPLEAERLADLPFGFRRAVVEAVFGDLRMDPGKGMR